MNLNNKTVLVTGANRGLGQALVQELLTCGVSKVYAAARTPASITTHDARVTAVALDVTDSASIRQLANELTDLDLVINNAGVIRFGDLLNASDDDFDHCFEVNLKGLWHVSQAFTAALSRGNGGAICNILSLLSLASMPGLAAYNASKAAAWSVTQSLRGTLKAHKIEVHAAYPGAIDTDMVAGIEMDKGNPADIAKDIVSGISQNQEDIYPGYAQQVYDVWKTDHKAVEREFAAT
ncbi:SDR family NAD(P)-dependent oxidoreductase [Gilvimarinus sp. SDUM040013]|uniref:SDR family NAD(P)-dependent oxidoreductase n=1 Tax=Gilvimarinus gilvus TaxID=3058038 RepID=A0ABU4RYM7_9GAMM|nr:SDR family NAD(P)-dependent oxidoreductase [Gilvimarinus sp. SDUM040013]MDO3386340.1 SDR family NAD(P)-dependent oxidoreductase [Gilvimarinus sp. SDUM040013]MDX6850002.1 SDR family NAD(P)-dependent oxidoreductase [Gilvimarinus sp. SDUM040013]